MYLKVTASNNRVPCCYVPSCYSTREYLARGHFFEGIQNYMKNKNEANENKIILGNLILLWIKWAGMVKIRYRLYRCCSTNVSPSYSQLKKTPKNNHSSASDWWGYTKSYFKENPKIFSKNSTTQANITISRKNLLFFPKTNQSNHFSASDLYGNSESRFIENTRTFSKNSITQKKY